MHTLTILVMSLLVGFSQPDKIDFGKRDSAPNWRVINDGVMGGLSQGQVSFSSNAIRFYGNVSLANNGGFASFRSPFANIDLSAFKSVTFRLKSTGIRCAFTLETDRRFWMPNFKHQIVTQTEDWEIIEIPLANFKRYRLGRPTGGSLPDRIKSEIIRMGWITDEKREGPFSLEVDYIQFNRE